MDSQVHEQKDVTLQSSIDLYKWIYIAVATKDRRVWNG